MTEKFYLVHPDGYLTYRVGRAMGRRPRQATAAGSSTTAASPRPRTPRCGRCCSGWTCSAPSRAGSCRWTTRCRSCSTTRARCARGRQRRHVAASGRRAALLAARSYRVEIEAVIEVTVDAGAADGGPDGATAADRPARRRPASTWRLWARPTWAATGCTRWPGPACCAATIRRCWTGSTWPSPPTGRPATAPRSKPGRVGPAPPAVGRVAFQHDRHPGQAAGAAGRRRAAVRSLVQRPGAQLRGGRPAAARARPEPAPARRLPVGGGRRAGRRPTNCGRRPSTAATWSRWATTSPPWS